MPNCSWTNTYRWEDRGATLPSVILQEMFFLCHSLGEEGRWRGMIWLRLHWHEPPMSRPTSSHLPTMSNLVGAQDQQTKRSGTSITKCINLAQIVTRSSLPCRPKWTEWTEAFQGHGVLLEKPPKAERLGWHCWGDGESQDICWHCCPMQNKTPWRSETRHFMPKGHLLKQGRPTEEAL